MNFTGGTSGQGGVSGQASSETSPGRAIPRQFDFAVLAIILGVTGLVVFFPPDGRERAEWVQFIGHFHPLTVHFPIALFLLVPVLEVCGRRRPFAFLRLSSPFVLALATMAATAAAFLGWCLGRSGGYTGSLITQHMWGGVLLSLICWVCWMLRARMPDPGRSYAIALAVGVGLIAWTGYRGGQLSLGANHLTEHMPAGLRQVLGVADSGTAVAEAVDPNTFYGARVQPIFNTRCVSCHSADKHKGSLRLDGYHALMRGGKDGPAIQPGNAQASDLFRRITLPANHDDFMPKGKTPLAAEEVKVIELWIGAGASATLAVDAIKNAPLGTAGGTVGEVKFEEIDPAAVARLRSAITPAVVQLQQRFPNVLDYESRDSADLRLNVSLLGNKFGDKDLEAFAPVAEHIAFADFSRTAITDQSAERLASMKRMRI